jgi:hypothetical protein
MSAKGPWPSASCCADLSEGRIRSNESTPNSTPLELWRRTVAGRPGYRPADVAILSVAIRLQPEMVDPQPFQQANREDMLCFIHFDVFGWTYHVINVKTIGAIMAAPPAHQHSRKNPERPHRSIFPAKTVSMMAIFAAITVIILSSIESRTTRY